MVTMEVAAASIGIAGFAFQVFEGCVQGFAFFNAAQNIGNDGDLFRAGLEMEKYRFLMWAKRAGISQEGIDENTNINWQLATMILEQLRGFLTSAENLRKRYKLVVVEDEVQDSEKVVVAEAPKQGLARLVSRLRPEIYTTTARIIQGNNGLGKRLRWTAVGKDQATRIVAEIAKMNGRLEFLLDSAQRELQAAESARFARSLISWSSTTTEVASIRLLLGDASAPQSDERGVIRAAALVKQIRLCIGSDRRDDEIQPQPKETRGTVPPLKILKRTLRPFAGQALAYRGLEFAVYDKQQVLVQWKVAEDEQWSKHLDQTKSLAVLLSSLSDQSFRCLPCLGYLAAESLGRHGLVFTLPAATARPWRMVSLSQLLEQQSQVPLNKRAQISHALAETVLQLHTRGDCTRT